MKSKLFAYGAGALLSLSAAQALAADNITINGFLTAAGTKGDSSGNAYLNGLYNGDGDVSFDNDNSRMGLQISAAVNDRTDITAQLLARGGPSGYNVDADWAFVSFHATDTTDLRAGKVKLPAFLVSDYIEVGYAYPWIRPPAEVYSLNPITSLSGADMLYRPSAGDWSFLIQPYFGSSQGKQVISPVNVDAINSMVGAGTLSRGDSVDFEARNLWGVNLSAGNDAFNFRLGYLQTDVDSNFGQSFGGTGIQGQTAKFTSAGFNMDWHNVVAYAEYASRDEESGALEQAFPDQDAWYATLGYRIGRFLPTVTHASIDKGSDLSPSVAALATVQDSTTLGLRYELGAGAALKFEAQRVKPGANSYGFFDLAPSARTKDNYTLYAVAVDVIF